MTDYYLVNITGIDYSNLSLACGDMPHPTLMQVINCEPNWHPRHDYKCLNFFFYRIGDSTFFARNMNYRAPRRVFRLKSGGYR